MFHKCHRQRRAPHLNRRWASRVHPPQHLARASQLEQMILASKGKKEKSLPRRKVAMETDLRGKENGSNVRKVDGDGALRWSGNDEDVGQSEKRNQHQKGFTSLAVLLRFDRVGRAQFRYQNLYTHKNRERENQ